MIETKSTPFLYSMFKMNLKISSWLLAVVLLLLSGCADFEPLARPEIRSDAQLSMSPSGNLVFLFRREPGKYSKMDGRLFSVENGMSQRVRQVNLPEEVWSTSWAYEEDQLLVAGVEGEENVLWKIDVFTDKRTVIYRSKQALNFLHEFTPGRYIFLEAYGVSSGRTYSTWQVLENGIKRQLYDRPFNSAAHISKIGDFLFLYPPDKILMTLEGKFPGFPEGVLDRMPWSLGCQKDKTTMCWQTYIEKYNGLFYRGTKEMIGDDGRCAVPGKWYQSSSSSLSRNGKTVVFHSLKDFDSKERGIFMVRFAPDTCLVNEIPLNGTSP